MDLVFLLNLLCCGRTRVTREEREKDIKGGRAGGRQEREQGWGMGKYRGGERKGYTVIFEEKLPFTMQHLIKL